MTRIIGITRIFKFLRIPIRINCSSTQAISFYSSYSWQKNTAHQPLNPTYAGFIAVKTRAMPQQTTTTIKTSKNNNTHVQTTSPLKMIPSLCPIRLDSRLCNRDKSKPTAAPGSCVIRPSAILRLLRFVLLSFGLAKIALYVCNLACASSKPTHLLMVLRVF